AWAGTPGKKATTRASAVIVLLIGEPPCGLDLLRVFYQRCGYNEPSEERHAASRSHHWPLEPPPGAVPGPARPARGRGPDGHPTLPWLKKASPLQPGQPRRRLAEVGRGIPLARSPGRASAPAAGRIPERGPGERRVSQLRRLHAHQRL